MVEPHNSNLRVITTNFLGVRIFRKFTVMNGSEEIWEEKGQYLTSHILTSHRKLAVILLKFENCNNESSASVVESLKFGE